MAQTVWSRLLGLSRPSPRGRVVGRPASASLAVELLEDRLVPSGGPGPSGVSGGPGPSVSSGGGPGSSSPPAITSGTSSGVIATATSGKTFQLGATLQALASGGLTVSQLFSGYPLAPNGGPSLQGDLLTLSGSSSAPLPMDNSTVAVVPVLLTSGGSGSYTLVFVDPVTGTNYSVPVNMTPPTTGG